MKTKVSQNLFMNCQEELYMTFLSVVMSTIAS